MMYEQPDPRNINELNFAIENAPTQTDVRELLENWTARVIGRAVAYTLSVVALCIFLLAYSR